MVLNEHGPALSVFWILDHQDWAQEQCTCGLPWWRRAVKRKLTKKKPSRREPGKPPLAIPLLSVRNEKALLQRR